MLEIWVYDFYCFQSQHLFGLLDVTSCFNLIPLSSGQNSHICPKPTGPRLCPGPGAQTE